jgi:hypothetical protein
MIQKVITRKFKIFMSLFMSTWKKKWPRYLKCGHDSAIMLTRIDSSCLEYNTQYSDKEEIACRFTGTAAAP